MIVVLVAEEKVVASLPRQQILALTAHQDIVGAPAVQ
jgi:hypothetical protein